MLLTIDQGNTNTVFGVFDGEDLTKSWRLSTQKERTVDEYGALLRSLFDLDKLDPDAIDRVIVSSVVPPLDPVLDQMVRRYFSVDAIFATPENAGVPVLYEDPAEVGADRIVNAVAVLERYGSPAIIVDFGTATTFDAITAKGEYLGGLITPGIEISANALSDRAARLPRIDIRKPDQFIGTSTQASLQAGFFWGYVSLVDGIIDRMRRELGEDSEIIATGGMAGFIQEESRWISTIDINLTLRACISSRGGWAEGTLNYLGLCL